ncbi:GGDEF domain-containing protein [Henriciella aquimarina]|uniref:GGDEF domain-containing protein n=1 Tax=Henriciella aquimarina TaxID=545261 RepID=UPI0009FDA261|nr:GGDEF domain-containing protein [Henriciella aquimarina]
MSAAVKKEAETVQPPMGGQEYKRVYDLADKAFKLMGQYETPPYPSTYALWYTYAERSNAELVEQVDQMLDKGTSLSPYEIDEACKVHLSEPDTQAGQQKIGSAFEKELSSVMALIQKGVSNHEQFQVALDELEEGLPQTVSPDRIDAMISQLMFENRRMARHSQELNDGLRESQKQIEKLNEELEEVRHQSMRDSLTMLANRRAFDKRLAAELSAAAEGDQNLCLVMADIDHFKTVNDTYGHRVGDEVLKIFARIITKNIKGQDMAARYGGEEFAVILPRTDLRAAYQLIDRIRVQFSKSNLVFKTSRQCLGQITASFGIARYKPGIDARDLIEQADQKLYLAKNSGRNTVKAEGLD